MAELGADLQAILTAISNLGFPIVCVIVMFYLQNREREAHAKEAEQWVEALNNNTIVMEKILTRIGENV